MRGAPTTSIQADFRTEWDHTSGAFLSFAANGIVNGSNLQASGGWSKQRSVTLDPVAEPIVTSLTHYLNASVTLRQAQNRFGGTYMFNYDLLRDNFLQQRYFAYYNAQCCGVSMQYSRASNAGAYVNSNNKFLFSVTLAGLGSFSPLDGGLGAIPR